MINFLVSLVGLLVFLFIYWKRLKEDYSSQIIFSSALTIIFGLFLGYFVTLKLFHGWFFWGSLVGLLAGLLVSAFRFKLRIYETLESLVLGFLPLLSLMFLMDSISNSAMVSFIAFVTVLFLIFVFYILEAKYREFTWYKSGKIGFTGLATLGILFLIRSGVAIFFHDVLSFEGQSEVYLSAVLAFGCFLLIFNLGRSQ